MDLTLGHGDELHSLIPTERIIEVKRTSEKLKKGMSCGNHSLPKAKYNILLLLFMTNNRGTQRDYL